MILWYEWVLIGIGFLVFFLLGAYFGWKVDHKAEEILLKEKAEKARKEEIKDKMKKGGILGI